MEFIEIKSQYGELQTQIDARVRNVINRKIKMGQEKVSGFQHRILVRSQV